MKKTDIVFISIICFLFLEMVLFIPLSLIFLEGYFWCLGISWVLFFIACPVLLYFQIKDKEKTTLNKVLLTINSFIVAAVVLTFILYTIVVNVAKKEIVNALDMGVLSDVSKEYPVVNYLEDYKKQNNTFPKVVQDKKLLEDKNVEKIEYEVSSDLNGYDLRVYKKNGSMEVYQRYESKNAKDNKNQSTFNYSYLNKKKAEKYKESKNK